MAAAAGSINFSVRYVFTGTAFQREEKFVTRGLNAASAAAAA